MLTIYSSAHGLHRGVELKDGAITESFEKPMRAETVLARVNATSLGDVIAPRDYDPSSYVGA
ncbi:histone deacetylase family protein, partial [Burkholderia gladioli]